MMTLLSLTKTAHFVILSLLQKAKNPYVVLSVSEISTDLRHSF